MKKKYLKIIMTSVLLSQTLMSAIPAFASPIEVNNKMIDGTSDTFMYRGHGPQLMKHVIDIPDVALKANLNFTLGHLGSYLFSNINNISALKITSLMLNNHILNNYPGYHNTVIKNLKGINNFINIGTFGLYGENRDIENLNELNNLNKLNLIILRNINNLENLNCINKDINLEQIDLSNNKNLTDISALKDFKNIQALNLTGVPGTDINKKIVADLHQSNPNLTIKCDWVIK